MNNWYAKPIPEILTFLKSSASGLANDAAAERLPRYGRNVLPQGKVDGLLLIFLRQFQSSLIYILLAACLAVFIMGETIDAAIILLVLLFNAVVGTIQEGKARNTLLALRQFAATKATVLRDGKELIIDDAEIVPGDVISLQAGEKIPADARLLICHNLEADEAAMTGESGPVHKNIKTLALRKLPVAEQFNMVFKGSHVLAGFGQAVVVATGDCTVIGKIAREIVAINTDDMPLKANIRYLSKLIILTVAGISLLLFFSGVALGQGAKAMFTTVVALSVSAIPEGLPIVITLILATGVWRMSKRRALVKKLQAVEALGQANVIAVDKTGTITKNELVIRQIYADGKLFTVAGVGYEPAGAIKFQGEVINSASEPNLILAGKTAVLCANARVMFSRENRRWQVAGDPTEAAMLVLAQKLGLSRDELERTAPKLSEIPFDYKFKYHAVVHDDKGQPVMSVAGAPEVILKLCHKIWRGAASHELTKQDKDELESVFHNMSRQGLRVVAVAKKFGAAKTVKAADVSELCFVGFLGMQDGLRAEVKKAMVKAMAAGIKVVMITGDHVITARAIAKEAGIYHETSSGQADDTVLTGEEIDGLSDKELSRKLERATVFARVTPEHKLLIIKAFKRRGDIVAMTGDGVNDAPSLVAADLGVAMGRIGTEVAKEAADIVLLDDNFGSIVSAIEEGRSIYKTIKKVVLYLFSTNLGEILAIGGSLFLGYPLPILPAQIIWLNFVTDGFLDVSLAMEPKDKDLLKRTFAKPEKHLLDKLMLIRMLVMALPMSLGALFVFRNYLAADLTKAWTMSLTVLAAFQWFNAWNCRSENKSIFQLNPLANKFLAGSTLIVIALQLLAIYNPTMQLLLHTSPLNLSEWLLIISVASSIILVEEVRKLFARRMNKYK